MNGDRILPRSTEAEIELLNACLAGPDGIAAASKAIRPDDLASVGGRRIFARILEFHQAGRRCSPTLIEQSFENDSDYMQIRRVFDELLPVTTTTATHFAKIIQEMSNRRRLIEATHQAHEELFDLGVSIEEAVKDLGKEIISVCA